MTAAKFKLCRLRTIYVLICSRDSNKRHWRFLYALRVSPHVHGPHGPDQWSPIWHMLASTVGGEFPSLSFTFVAYWSSTLIAPNLRLRMEQYGGWTCAYKEREKSLGPWAIIDIPQTPVRDGTHKNGIHLEDLHLVALRPVNVNQFVFLTSKCQRAGHGSEWWRRLVRPFQQRFGEKN